MKRLQFLLYSSFVAIYILNLFIESIALNYLQGLIGILALIFSFVGANRTYQVIGTILTVVSSLLFIVHGLSLTNLALYFTSMGLLLSLLYIIPFINHYMIVGRYDQALYKILQSNTHHLGKFYAKSYLTSYTLTLFIFVSTIPLVYQFIREQTSQFNQQITNQFATRSILRPFAAANVWSPIEVYIALVVAITGSYYLHLLPFLIGFSLIMLTIDISLGYFRYRSYTLLPNQEVTKVNRQAVNKLLTLICFLVLFVGTATGTHIALNLEFFDAIIIVIIPYTLLWAYLTGKFRTFIRYNQKVWGGHLWTMQNFMVLLLPVGLFNEVISDSGVLNNIMKSLVWLEHQPLLLLIFIQISSMFLAFVGFHPLLTLSIQGLFITPFLDTINPLSVSIVMIVSVVTNDMTGTFNVPITMLNQYLKRNPYHLTLWNIGYALLFGGIGVFIGYLLL
ncbi:hypothetical protein [Alkalibacillus aidingensis]|uniref:hypothetical protein n=1 Tax=Alkalibacillus aidingensis TaxID=2747607 RepID=UPI0016604E54|nr:hypothetical protein [Alkalibacillus aidingensis]